MMCRCILYFAIKCVRKVVLCSLFTEEFTWEGNREWIVDPWFKYVIVDH